MTSVLLQTNATDPRYRRFIFLAENTDGSAKNDLTGNAIIFKGGITSFFQNPVTAITQANPGVVTSTAHPFNVGDLILMSFTTVAIGNITQANPGVITFGSMPYADGEEIQILGGVVGMSQVNGQKYVLHNISGNTAHLYHTDGTTTLDTTGFGAYNSGGFAVGSMLELYQQMVQVTAITTNTFTLGHPDGTALDTTSFHTYNAASGGTADQMGRQSTNQVVWIGPGLYSLDLALPGVISIADPGEIDAIGPGVMLINRTGMLPILERFDALAFDPRAAGPTVSATATAIGDLVIESGITLVQALQYIAAATVGKATGFPSAPVLDAVGNDGTHRITATVDGAGNRTNALT